jgi:DNA-directed RNA polymerase subunit alpha
MSSDIADAGAAAVDPNIADGPAPFDIVHVENPSFAMLLEGRSAIFVDRPSFTSFTNTVAGLGETGDEGRRKGLGHWMLGEYAAAAAALAEHTGDDTAAYTRARSLMELGQYDEALPIFERLSDAYPNEPRPREGRLTAQLEIALAAEPEDTTPVADKLDADIAAAPGEFAETAEGKVLAGRACELRRDWEGALGHYETARTLDPTHRTALFRLAFLSERGGLDELAVEAYEALIAQKPVARSVLMTLGVLYEDVGRDTDAAACYDVVARNLPTDAYARLYLEDARAAMDMYYDEDLEKKEDRLNQILRIPITDFELSVRARNCLNKMEIATLGDLVCRTEQELLSYKNFGETSLTEIKEILHSKGLRLGMPREEAVASIEAHSRTGSSSDRSDVTNRPILDLQLSIRARRTVENLGCLTVGDIVKHSAEELLGMPNFGQTSLQELRSKLSELGIKLKGE